MVVEIEPPAGFVIGMVHRLEAFGDDALLGLVEIVDEVAEAGVAPPVRWADPASGVVVMDYIAPAEGRGWLLDTAPGLPALGACVAAAPAGPLVLWVGPEGGFAPDEREAAHAAGLGLASLGGAALRTATAAVAAAAVVLASAPASRADGTN